MHGPVIRAFAELPFASCEHGEHQGMDLARKQVAVLQLINAYRFLGVRQASLDPLGRHPSLKLLSWIRFFMGLLKQIGCNIQYRFSGGSATLNIARNFAVAADLLRQHRCGIYVHQ